MEWASNFFIRPPRANYTRESLGPEFIRFGGAAQKTEVYYERIDFEATNTTGMILQGSLFSPCTALKESLSPRTCPVYLHGSAGSRKDALTLLTVVAAHKLPLLCFDFGGCGLSEGHHVSLGWHEKDDLYAVLEHVLKTFQTITSFVLWGRSMGAVTALQYIRAYGLTEPTILGVILDSPYSVLWDLVEELVDEQTSIFSPFFKLCISGVRKSIKHLANFDIKDLDNCAACTTLTVPAIFLHGKEDTFIHPHHSQRLFDSVPLTTNKQIYLIPGGHNTPRCQLYYSCCSSFLWQCSNKDPTHPDPVLLRIPPGYEIQHFLCEIKTLQRTKAKQEHFEPEITLASLEVRPQAHLLLIAQAEGISQSMTELIIVTVEPKNLLLIKPFVGDVDAIVLTDILDYKLIDHSLFFSLKGSRYVVLTSHSAHDIKVLITQTLEAIDSCDDSSDPERRRLKKKFL